MERKEIVLGWGGLLVWTFIVGFMQYQIGYHYGGIDMLRDCITFGVDKCDKRRFTY